MTHQRRWRTDVGIPARHSSFACHVSAGAWLQSIRRGGRVRRQNVRLDSCYWRNGRKCEWPISGRSVDDGNTIQPKVGRLWRYASPVPSTRAENVLPTDAEILERMLAQAHQLVAGPAVPASFAVGPDQRANHLPNTRAGTSQPP